MLRKLINFLLAISLICLFVGVDSFINYKVESEEVVRVEDTDYVGDLKKDIDFKIFMEQGALTEMRAAKFDLVYAAQNEIGNVGGEPYWRWYGLNFKVAWCAIFVSYCAEQCGYIEAGIIPKFASVPRGIEWFKERNEWLLPGNVPSPGMIIFFDFENYDAGIYWVNDGKGDHVGIVEKVVDGYVYCIEGNNGDKCKETSYPVNSRWILGYGTPDYSSLD